MTADFFDFQQKLLKPRPAPKPQAAPSEQPISVSELTARITRVINTGLPGNFLVRGEVSNFGRNKASGHVYFTLKDAEACIDCVMFRSEAGRLKFEPDDGMELLAGGRIGVYGPRGRYQLYVSSLRPLGQGALELAFRQMKAKLEAEGLFAPERKKPLPGYPQRIVLITSPQAAALHDMLKVLRRFPCLRIMLYPAPVQGDGAGQKIAAAIRHINSAIDEIGGAEVIILARGGGSLEDLWAFNEECVARALAASRIPVVSGIGHEVDVSIADLAADYHAHTPTEAAQIVTANWRTAQSQVEERTHRLHRSLRSITNDCRQRLAGIERHEAFRRPMGQVNVLRQLLDDRDRALILAQDQLLRTRRDRLQDATGRLQRFLPSVVIRCRQRLNDWMRSLDQALGQRLRGAHERLARATTLLQECHPRHAMQLTRQRLQTAEGRLARAARQNVQRNDHTLDSLARQLEAISPQSVLRRGYTMTTRKKDGATLRSAAQLGTGEKIVTHFADGQVESTVNDSKQLSLFD
ncbi:MAG TPA: exodeoxyribonuclease VII large subunit [Tepidisphaeraceae bacterium]|nr:exodeoxyribonuclease VII large subunit [Tepidisphaeraceae bacterium]